MATIPKKIINQEQLKEKIINITNLFADTVCATLGPKGKNVLIQKSFGDPIITKDGVTVARHIEFADSTDNMIAQILKQTSEKSNLIAGDGTTSTLALTQTLVNEGFKKLKNQSFISLREELEVGLKQVITKLRVQSIKATKEQLRQISQVSANDERVGNFIADVLEEVGDNGVVAFEDIQTENGLTKRVIRGMEIDKGYASANFINNEKRLEAELEDVKVLMTDQRIHSTGQIIPWLEILLKDGFRKLVIVADDFGAEVLTFLVQNKKNFETIAIQASGHGSEQKRNHLADLAASVGGFVIESEKGQEIKNIDLAALGHAERVISGDKHTIFIGGKGNTEPRIAYLKTLIKESKDDLEAIFLKTRLAKLTDGIGMVSIGCATDSERVELKYRLEDAIRAYRSAKEHGVLVGGGLTLYNLSIEFEIDSIWHKTLQTPLALLIKNSKVDDDTVSNTETFKNIGINFKTNRLENLLEAGILDSAQVTILALENAISIALILLNLDSAIEIERG